jgi:hypothetical protein
VNVTCMEIDLRKMEAALHKEQFLREDPWFQRVGDGFVEDTHLGYGMRHWMLMRED